MSNQDSQQTARADEWLSHIKRAARTPGRGRLKIFLGMCAGVGKTFAMLRAAQAEKAQGRRVLAGVVETHGRTETEAELRGIEVLPKRKTEYRGTVLEEFDLDEALNRNPNLLLVDELAHTNVPGSRHQKRYEDVLELLRKGINVCTTLNVQHLESRSDPVGAITGITVHETVPDTLLDEADEIELIDLSPEHLMERLHEGKVYLGDKKEQAIRNFFRPENLTALRELSFRVAAERVDQDLTRLRKNTGDEKPWHALNRILAAIGPNPQGERLIRAARRLAYNLEAPWIVVYVNDGRSLNPDEESFLERNMSLAKELGAEVIVRDDPDLVEGLLRTARERNVTQIMLGKPEGKFAFTLRSRWLERLFSRAGGIDLIFVPTGTHRQRSIIATDTLWWRGPKRHFVYALIISGASSLVATIVYQYLGYYAAGLILLISVLGGGLFLYPSTVVFLSVFQALIWNFFFIEPKYTFDISKPEDIVLCLIFALTGITLGTSTARLQLREVRSRKGEADALAQAELLSLIRDARQENSLLRESVTLLERFFGIKSTFVLRAIDGSLPKKTTIETPLQLDTPQTAVTYWAIDHGEEAGRWTKTLRDSSIWCCPLKTPTRVLGVWVIDASKDASIQASDREAIRSLASSLALGLDRLRFDQIEKESTLTRESERLQKALMNTVSHEIRTPLTTVIGQLEMWAHDQAFSEEFRKKAEHSLRNAKEVDNIIEDIVSLSRIESENFEHRLDWVDLEEIFSEKMQKLSELHSEHQFLGLFGAKEYLLVQGEPTLLRVVMRNLLENACKHTPSGTRIQATWKQDKKELWIEDSGPGIPKELSVRVFEKFYRGGNTKQTYGLGLGLSLAKAFMELIHGTIRVEVSSLGGAALVLGFDPTRVRAGQL